MSRESFNSPIHLNYVRKEYYKTNRIKNVLPSSFLQCWWPKLTPHQLCLLQHIIKPCGLHYLVSDVLTVQEISYCHFQLGVVAPSNVTGHCSIKTFQN